MSKAVEEDMTIRDERRPQRGAGGATCNKAIKRSVPTPGRMSSAVECSRSSMVEASEWCRRAEVRLEKYWQVSNNFLKIKLLVAWPYLYNKYKILCIKYRCITSTL